MMQRSPLKQIALPFADGEAAHAERWNDLGIALLRVGRHCDARLATLVRWIFNVTHGGTSGALTKCYGELAERPWGLCCDARTARRTVEMAEKLGLISVAANRRFDGSQQPNAYTINWDGVRALKRGVAGGHFDHPGGQIDQGGGQDVRHTKEFSLSSVFNSDTGPGADPNPKDSDNDEGRPRMAAFPERQNDSRTNALLAQSPILTAAKERRIAPLPAGVLLHGVYAPIKEHHLHQPLRFVAWHRKQLSTAVPVMGDTEADLLLTIATALYATSLRDSEVTKSRAAVFVGTIARQKFLRSMPFVPQARMLLDEWIAHNGLASAGLAEETAHLETQTVEAEA